MSSPERPSVRRRLLRLAILIAVLIPGALLVLRLATSGRPDELGVKDGALAPVEGRSNAVYSLSQEPDTQVRPLTVRGPADAAFNRLVGVLEGLPRATLVTREAGYAHVEVRSPIFRFIDDVEVLLLPGKRRIEIRSAARSGKSDLGVNRERVEAIRAAYEATETK